MIYLTKKWAILVIILTLVFYFSGKYIGILSNSIFVDAFFIMFILCWGLLYIEHLEDRIKIIEKSTQFLPGSIIILANFCQLANERLNHLEGKATIEKTNYFN